MWFGDGEIRCLFVRGAVTEGIVGS